MLLLKLYFTRPEHHTVSNISNFLITPLIALSWSETLFLINVIQAFDQSQKPQLIFRTQLATYNISVF